MRRIAVINQKGGVGKTTTTVNLGAALARLGQRVLVCDMDAQCNLTVHLDADPASDAPSIYELLHGKATLAEVLRDTTEAKLQMLASSIDLAGIELELVNAVGRETILRDALAAYIAQHGETWDFLLVDCPPSLGLLSLNALVACHEVFVPIQSEFFALQGLGKLLEIVELVQRRLNPSLRITGMVSVRHDPSTNLGRQVLADIRAHFGDVLMDTAIRRNVKLAEAPSHGKTIFEYDAECRGAQDYLALAREVLGVTAPAEVAAVAAVVAAAAATRPSAASRVASAGGALAAAAAAASARSAADAARAAARARTKPAMARGANGSFVRAARTAVPTPAVAARSERDVELKKPAAPLPAATSAAAAKAPAAGTHQPTPARLPAPRKQPAPVAQPGSATLPASETLTASEALTASAEASMAGKAPAPPQQPAAGKLAPPEKHAPRAKRPASAALTALAHLTAAPKAAPRPAPMSALPSRLVAAVKAPESAAAPAVVASPQAAKAAPKRRADASSGPVPAAACDLAAAPRAVERKPAARPGAKPMATVDPRVEARAETRAGPAKVSRGTTHGTPAEVKPSAAMPTVAKPTSALPNTAPRPAASAPVRDSVAGIGEAVAPPDAPPAPNGARAPSARRPVKPAHRAAAPDAPPLSESNS